MLNKVLLTSYGFRFPVFLTLIHMTACTLLSYVATRTWKVVPLQAVRSRRQMEKIFLLSFVFCISLVFGNISLRYLTVSFNQMVGATTPFFTALLSMLITSKVEKPMVYLSLIFIAGGIIISSNGEPELHVLGTLLCFLATSMRALKSVLQGILLTDPREKMNGMNLLYKMAPLTCFMLIPYTYMAEDIASIARSLAQGDKRFFILLFLNASLAWLANLFNFLVTKHTSALTLQVAGNFKGVLAVLLSILLLGNTVTLLGFLGYGITIFGVIMYARAK